jgi:stage II sporulation protein GA (sporulation sigma-E factor processing peptidase)
VGYAGGGAVATVGALALYGANNLALDATALYVAARLGGERATWRLFAAAVVGGLYALWPAAVDGGAVGRGLCALAMVVIAHGPAHPLRVAGRLGYLLAAAALVGGGAVAALAVIGRGTPAAAGAMPLGGLAAAAAALLTVGRWTRARRRRVPSGGLDLEVEMGGRRVRLRGWVDTGNRLREPVGRMPVVVAEAAPLAALVPVEARAAYLREAAAGLMPDRLASLCPAWAERLRAVPYRAVGAQGVLAAIRPDGVWALVDGRRIAVRAVVALAPRPFGWADAQALVPADLLSAHPTQVGA